MPSCCSCKVGGPQKQIAINFAPASHKAGTALLSIKTIQDWSESSTLPKRAVSATGAANTAKEAVGARHPTFAYSCGPLLLINAFSSLGASIKLCQDSTNLFISGFLLSCDILLLFWNPDR